MTEVKFLADFRGKLTKENFYTAGTVASFETGVAVQIVELGFAELVEVEQEKEQPIGEVLVEKPARKRTTK
jgi:hypothetical protein